MARTELFKEISKIYDIKQRVGVDKYNPIHHYIEYRGININVFIEIYGYLYFDSVYFNTVPAIKKYVDKNILLIDKLNEIFEFTYHNYVIQVGNTEVYFRFGNNIYVKNLQFHKVYDDVLDVIECLKKLCPECIKSGDIKIALKD